MQIATKGVEGKSLHRLDAQPINPLEVTTIVGQERVFSEDYFG